jgi:hypothetical protein
MRERNVWPCQVRARHAELERIHQRVHSAEGECIEVDITDAEQCLDVGAGGKAFGGDPQAAGVDAVLGQDAIKAGAEALDRIRRRPVRIEGVDEQVGVRNLGQQPRPGVLHLRNDFEVVGGGDENHRVLRETQGRSRPCCGRSLVVRLIVEGMRGPGQEGETLRKLLGGIHRFRQASGNIEVDVRETGRDTG